MKLKYLIILIVLIILVIPLLSVIFLEEVKTIEATVTIGDYLGFNIDTDKLYFGTFFAGGSGKRDFQIENYKCDECLVVIKAYGPLAKYLKISDNKFVMKYGENRTVTALVNTPQDIPNGAYNATIKVYFWKTI